MTTPAPFPVYFSGLDALVQLTDCHNLIISRSTPNSMFNFPGEGMYCLFVGFDKRGREEL
jgi:hypothetical protein